MVLPDWSQGDTLTDRCLWIGAREILVRSDLVGSNRCLWIGVREIDACLIGAREIDACLIGAREIGACLIKVVDRCL